MTKSTQRTISTLATLAIVGGGLYYMKQRGLLDALIDSLMPEHALRPGESTAPTPSPQPAPAPAANTGQNDALLNNIVDQLSGFKTTMFSIFTALQGEYSKPGSSSGTNATVNHPGASVLF